CLTPALIDTWTVQTSNDVDTILIAETLFYMWHRLCRGCFVTNDILRMGRDSPISILCMPDQL
ncbi:hypothetical protein ISN45_At01g022270, partial [Arabidopsis thaliana x Arabidopsis arenosa]